MACPYSHGPSMRHAVLGSVKTTPGSPMDRPVHQHHVDLPRRFVAPQQVGLAVAVVVALRDDLPGEVGFGVDDPWLAIERRSSASRRPARSRRCATGCRTCRRRRSPPRRRSATPCWPPGRSSAPSGRTRRRRPSPSSGRPARSSRCATGAGSSCRCRRSRPPRRSSTRCWARCRRSPARRSSAPFISIAVDLAGRGVPPQDVGLAVAVEVGRVHDLPGRDWPRCDHRCPGGHPRSRRASVEPAPSSRCATAGPSPRRR